MKAEKITGLLLGGSLKQAGISFYVRGGKMVARVARSNERRSNTRGQFVARQRMRHTTALWQLLKPCQPMFVGGKSAYARFATLANSLPAVFVEANGATSGATFLMDGMPLSEGTLPAVGLQLGAVEGVPALLTDLRAGTVGQGETLRLYTLEQTVAGQRPELAIRFRDMRAGDFEVFDGRLVLVGQEYGNEMMGWGVVRIDGDRCSPQVCVSRCRYYERFTGEEALQKAAASYGGLTD